MISTYTDVVLEGERDNRSTEQVRNAYTPPCEYADSRQATTAWSTVGEQNRYSVGSTLELSTRRLTESSKDQDLLGDGERVDDTGLLAQLDQVVDLLSQQPKADGGPRRPMNAFLIYARWRRTLLARNHNRWGTGEAKQISESPVPVEHALLKMGRQMGPELGLKPSDVSAALGEEWRSLTPKQQAPFQRKASELRNDFDRRHPDYKFRRGPKGAVKLRRLERQRQQMEEKRLQQMEKLRSGGQYDIQRWCDGQLYKSHQGDQHPHLSSATIPMLSTMGTSYRHLTIGRLQHGLPASDTQAQKTLSVGTHTSSTHPSTTSTVSGPLWPPLERSLASVRRASDAAHVSSFRITSTAAASGSMDRPWLQEGEVPFIKRTSRVQQVASSQPTVQPFSHLHSQPWPASSSANKAHGSAILGVNSALSTSSEARVAPNLSHRGRYFDASVETQPSLDLSRSQHSLANNNTLAMYSSLNPGMGGRRQDAWEDSGPLSNCHRSRAHTLDSHGVAHSYSRSVEGNHSSGVLDNLFSRQMCQQSEQQSYNQQQSDSTRPSSYVSPLHTHGPSDRTGENHSVLRDPMGSSRIAYDDPSAMLQQQQAPIPTTTTTTPAAAQGQPDHPSQCQSRSSFYLGNTSDSGTAAAIALEGPTKPIMSTLSAAEVLSDDEDVAMTSTTMSDVSDHTIAEQDHQDQSHYETTCSESRSRSTSTEIASSSCSAPAASPSPFGSASHTSISCQGGSTSDLPFSASRPQSFDGGSAATTTFERSRSSSKRVDGSDTFGPLLFDTAGIHGQRYRQSQSELEEQYDISTGSDAASHTELTARARGRAGFGLGIRSGFAPGCSSLGFATAVTTRSETTNPSVSSPTSSTLGSALDFKFPVNCTKKTPADGQGDDDGTTRDDVGG